MSPAWDPALYLRHADERSRPFVDLVGRIDATRPRTIVDLGCGPGHLTAVLRGRWPDADVVGVDSSPEMIERARATSADPRTRYEVADVAAWTPTSPVDVMVSNALFQWVPDAHAVVRRLAGHVRDGGWFALQVPDNFDAPSHRLLHAISSRPPYAAHTEGLHQARGASVESYLELFAGWG